jgi:hypothetical protein
MFIIFEILDLCSFVRARNQFSETCKLSNITAFSLQSLNVWVSTGSALPISIQ